MVSVAKKKIELEAWQDPKAKPYIEIDNVSKSYEGVPALNHVSLSIYQGEFFSLLGPSGCGKTTLLRLLAGFDIPDSGKVFIDGAPMAGTPSYERPVNMMFQSYALFPHMTVEQNILFGLKHDRLNRDEAHQRLADVLKLVRMTKYARRKPHQLSGGQRQRVALARSLVKRPKLLLLDEPLAALDRGLRKDTQFELVNIQEEVGITFIMVTHDQEEAMTMSTRLAIMEEGRIRQIGQPQEVYEYPNSHYVAGFMGSMNIFDGIVVSTDPDSVLVRSQQLGGDLLVSHSSSVPIGAQVSVAIRPEKIIMSKRLPQVRDHNCVKGVVDEIAYFGDVSTYHVLLPSGQIVMATVPNSVRLAERSINWEDEVYLYWRAENGVVLLA